MKSGKKGAKRRVSYTPYVRLLRCHVMRGGGGNLAGDISEIEHQNHDAAIQTRLYHPLACSVLHMMVTSVEQVDEAIHG